MAESVFWLLATSASIVEPLAAIVDCAGRFAGLTHAISDSGRLSSLVTRGGEKSVLIILVLSAQREDEAQRAPFIGPPISPRFTILLTERGAIFWQMSPPQPRRHSSSFKNEACFPAEIHTVAPWSSAWRVDALEIWLASHTVSSCAAAYQ